MTALRFGPAKPHFCERRGDASTIRDNCCCIDLNSVHTSLTVTSKGDTLLEEEVDKRKEVRTLSIDGDHFDGSRKSWIAFGSKVLVSTPL